MKKQEKLDKLKKKMEGDKSLPLRKEANKLVFGDGDAETEILFIGEGPGYWEDQKGIPFVGNAGAFLNSLLASIKLDRKDVYITNVVHYRPPNNRDPESEELAAFRPYLDKIIEIIDPKVIVTLGRFSMRKFLPSAMISKVHGKAQKINYNGKERIIVPMYHPAAGLRNGEIKRRTIEDFKEITKSLRTLKEEKSEPEAQQMQLI